MKRVLIIIYYWPPAGGPGVQRWLNFVKYFRDFGIEPVVFVPKNPHYPILDASFVSEIPSGIEIIKFPIKEPYALAGLFSKKKTNTISKGILPKSNVSFLEKIMLYIRGNFFIPDARILWVKPSVKFLMGYLAKNPVEAIVTSGPPHSLHLIGMHLKKKINVKWLADFRDPWTDIHYHNSLRLSKKSQLKHKKLEADVLKTADKIVVTSPSLKYEFQKITAAHIDVITNGFDFSVLQPIKLDKKFSIVHIGSLLNGRNPKLLWEVLQELCLNSTSFSKDLQIKLIGTVSQEVLKSIKNYGLQEFLICENYIPHSEVLQIQWQSQILLLVEIDSPETQTIIPGKIFEYLAAKRPILAFGPKKSDIKQIIDETESGHFLNYGEDKKLKEILLQYYNEFQNGNLAINSKNLDKFERKELTRKMSLSIQSI